MTAFVAEATRVEVVTGPYTMEGSHYDRNDPRMGAKVVHEWLLAWSTLMSSVSTPT